MLIVGPWIVDGSFFENDVRGKGEGEKGNMNVLINAAAIALVPPGLILMAFLGLTVVVNIVSMAQRFKRCPANKLLVISGRTDTGGVKVLHGGAEFIWPLLQQFDFIDLTPHELSVEVGSAVTSDGCEVNVSAAATVVVSSEPGSMQNAAAHLLGLTAEEIQRHSASVISDQLAQVIAGKSANDLQSDRATLIAQIKAASETTLASLGLRLVAITIEAIDTSGINTPAQTLVT